LFTAVGPDLATLSDGRFISTTGFGDVFSSIWSTLSLPNDYTPNFLSDLVWRNDNGQLALWDMGNNGAITGSGFLTSGGQMITPPPTFSIAAFSDFNGDGAADLVWRDTSGITALWIMNGSAIAAS